MAGPVSGNDSVLVAIFQCAVNTKYCSVTLMLCLGADTERGKEAEGV